MKVSIIDTEMSTETKGSTDSDIADVIVGTETPNQVNEDGSSQETESKPKLPKGVTEAPRSAEEMHLKHIRNWPNAVEVYLQVSDDEGEVLGSKVLEKKVKQFCDRYANPKAEIKDLAKVIEEAKDRATDYTLQINMVESGLTGAIVD